MTVARSLVLAIVGGLAALASGPGPVIAQSGDAAIAGLLEPIRTEERLPALGAAVVTSRGLLVGGATGVRKSGTGTLATSDDLWHLGSNTKAMTAVLAATFVERGMLTWDTTLGQTFPDRAASWPADFRAITVAQLLSHRSGLPANLDYDALARSMRSVSEQRLDAVTMAATGKLSSQPGTASAYSNLGYVLTGAIIERIAGQPWEQEMRARLFKPLGMTTCGFGGVGTRGVVDQPWPHRANGEPMPDNGPATDNRPVLGPAGTVHCSTADWSKFIADQLRGARGAPALLRADAYKALHTPRVGGGYAFGWGVTSRSFGGGTVLQHSGSNTMNSSVVWVAPLRDFAVLAVTNQGGERGQDGVNAAADALIRLHAKP